jgi:hypothetical protein
MRHIIAVLTMNETLFVADFSAEKLSPRFSRAKQINLKTTELRAAEVRKWEAVKEMKGKVVIRQAVEEVAEKPKAKRGRPAKVVTDEPKIDGRLMRGFPKSVSKLSVTELQALSTKLNAVLASQVAAATVEVQVPATV